MNAYEMPINYTYSTLTFIYLLSIEVWDEFMPNDQRGALIPGAREHRPKPLLRLNHSVESSATALLWGRWLFVVTGAAMLVPDCYMRETHMSASSCTSVL